LGASQPAGQAQQPAQGQPGAHREEDDEDGADQPGDGIEHRRSKEGSIQPDPVYCGAMAAPGTRITAGTHRGRILKTRAGLETRPTTALVREALFNIIGASIEGATVLDLFSGGGTLGFEALSRGAARVTFVDRAQACATIVAENLAATGFAQRAEVHSADALVWLKAHRSDLSAFNLILLDPPYRSTAMAETLHRLDSLPLRPEALVAAEHHRLASIPALERLQPLRQHDYGSTRLSFFRYPG